MDRGFHDHTGDILDHESGDIAANSYRQYKEDIQYLKTIGVNFYRFSISWSRILPTGRIDNVNQAGIEYYNNVINELLANGIEPYVTIYHFDLPQALQDQGGWPERVLADYYVDYARLLFQNFGDRVKTWFTFSDIMQTCEGGYSEGTFPPFIRNPGVGGYECAHTILLAHGRAFRVYDQEFRGSQNGRVSIAIDAYWHDPESAQAWDLEASETALQMNVIS